MQNMEKVNVTEYLDEFENIKAQIAILVKRQRGNYTQEAYASKIGITPKSLYNYETGKQLIRTDVIRKMFRSNPSLMREVMQLRKAASNSRGNAKRAGNKALKPVNVLNKVPIKDLCDGITTRIGLDKSHTLYEEWGVCSTMATKNLLRKDRNYLIISAGGQFIVNPEDTRVLMPKYNMTEISLSSNGGFDPFARMDEETTRWLIKDIIDDWAYAYSEFELEYMAKEICYPDTWDFLKELIFNFLYAYFYYSKSVNNGYIDLSEIARIYDAEDEKLEGTLTRKMEEFYASKNLIDLDEEEIPKFLTDESWLTCAHISWLEVLDHCNRKGAVIFPDGKPVDVDYDGVHRLENIAIVVLGEISKLPSHGEGKDLLENLFTKDKQLVYLNIPKYNTTRFLINQLMIDILSQRKKIVDPKPLDIMILLGKHAYRWNGMYDMLKKLQKTNTTISFYEMERGLFEHRYGHFAPSEINTVTDLELPFNPKERNLNMALVQQKGKKPKVVEYKFEDLHTTACPKLEYSIANKKEDTKNV